MEFSTRLLRFKNRINIFTNTVKDHGFRKCENNRVLTDALRLKVTLFSSYVVSFRPTLSRVSVRTNNRENNQLLYLAGKWDKRKEILIFPCNKIACTCIESCNHSKANMYAITITWHITESCHRV